MATQNVTNTANLTPEILLQEVQLAYAGATPMKGIVSYVAEENLSEGKTVKVPVLGSYSVVKKVAGTDLVPQATTSTEVVIDIDQDASILITVEDVLSIQAGSQRANSIVQSAVNGMVGAVEGDLMGLYVDAGSTVEATTVLTSGEIKKAKKALDKAKMPATNRYIVVGPDQYDQLLSDSTFVQYDANKGVNDSITSGALGRIFGFEVFMSNYDKITDNAGTEVYNGLAFHSSAIAFAEQKMLSVETQRNLRSKGDDVLFNNLYGLAVVRENGVVHLQSTEAGV